MERTGISLNFEHLWNSSSLLFWLDLVSTRSMFLELGCGLSDNKQLFLLKEVTIYFYPGQFKWQLTIQLTEVTKHLDSWQFKPLLIFWFRYWGPEKYSIHTKKATCLVAYVYDLVIVDCCVKKVRSLVYIRILFIYERGDQPHRAPSSCCASASVALAAHWELVLIL